MAIACWGFDVCDTDELPQQWDGGSSSWTPFAIALVPPYPGSAGSAVIIPGSPGASRVLGESATWSVGCNLQQNSGYDGGTGPGAIPSQNQIIQLAFGAQPVLSIEMETSGAFVVILGGTGDTGTGTPLGTTAGGLWLKNSWVNGYLELEASGLGTGSTNWALYLNDVLLISGTCDTSGLGLPDRLTIINQPITPGAFETNTFMDHLYANQGPRLGPIRITSLIPISDAAGNWVSLPGPARYTSVNDAPGVRSNYPDGDATTLTPGASANQLFLVGGIGGGPSPCYGRILGVMLNACYRSGGVDAIVLQQSAVYDFGTMPPNSSMTYHTYQAFAATSFLSGTYWTDAEINNAFWGVGNAFGGVVLTQVFLEKIVSLRAVPYNCGGAGSYSF